MEKKVIEMMAEFTEIPQEKITTDSSLMADLGLSSLDMIDAVMAFEEEFAIAIPEEDIWNLATVGDVAEYINRHTGR